jgi:2-succinyl-6-hydroxy-2,4-cyclohexadiene-1-carboxylate synthase
VLLHGFTGSASGWGQHLHVFAATGWRVIALDLLGHGASDAPQDPERYSIQESRQDILAALKELDVPAGAAVLLGYSLGGRIALYTALSGFFRGLVLESASPGIADAAEREQRRISDEAVAARIEREGVTAFVDYWERLSLFASQQSLPVERRAALRRQRLRNRASGLANSLRGVGAGVQPALHEALAGLYIPCLLIAGAQDAKYSRIAEEMAMQLPQPTLCLVPEAGHTVHLERPEAFTAAVLGFCLELSASSQQQTRGRLLQGRRGTR